MNDKIKSTSVYRVDHKIKDKHFRIETGWNSSNKIGSMSTY
jgi:hypothetical protein